jgi:hypothetical protein
MQSNKKVSVVTRKSPEKGLKTSLILARNGFKIFTTKIKN